MIRILIILFFCSAFQCQLSAQQWLTGIETTWTDSFVEWQLYTEIDESSEDITPTGELELRWKNQDNWTEWDFDIDGFRGQILQASRNQPNQWEVRSDQGLITIRTRWVNDLTEWKITNNNISLVFKSRWRNTFNEWVLTDKKYGHFSIKAAWDGDPRQWDIYDELDEQITLSMKMAMVFVATFYSAPKI